MIEVYPHLWVGDQGDYEFEVRGKVGWFTIHACKEPYHRQALGYTGRGAPLAHPEYLVAFRGNELMLNMVDTDDARYFSEELIREALDCLDRYYPTRKNILIHCNQGESRAPSLALLWLAQSGYISNGSYAEATQEFVLLYPPYDPSPGITRHLTQHWKRYMGEEEEE